MNRSKLTTRKVTRCIYLDLICLCKTINISVAKLWTPSSLSISNLWVIVKEREGGVWGGEHSETRNHYGPNDG